MRRRDRFLAAPKTDPPAPLSWPCYDCGEAFATSLGLTSHATARHGHRSHVRRLIRGQICPACLVDFRTHRRALQHAKDAKRCLPLMMAIAAEQDFSSDDDAGGLAAARTRTARRRIATTASGRRLGSATSLPDDVLPARRVPGPLRRALG